MCIYFHSVLGLKAEIQVLVTENSDLSHTITQLNSSLSEQKVHVHVHKFYTHVDMNNHVQRKKEKTKTRETANTYNTYNTQQSRKLDSSFQKNMHIHVHVYIQCKCIWLCVLVIPIIVGDYTTIVL